MISCNKEPQRSEQGNAKQEVGPGSETKGLPRELKVNLGGGIKLEMVLIPAGEFLMGSPDSDKQALDNEKPQHRLRITRPFYLGKYQVTQEEYQQVTGYNPSAFSATGQARDRISRQDTKRFPVENVTWDEAVEFCHKLSNLPEEKAAGRTYRLPSEAQWEYACRAGSMTKWCCGDDEASLVDYGWFDANSARTTHPVGEKKPNAWGLYDMHGNGWEWCQDWYDSGYYAHSPADDPMGPVTGSLRVFRGGGWIHEASCLRSAFRNFIEPGHRSDLGLRVVVVPAE
jgi:formylglycine-generating enzyme required for sulfatase activity